MSVENADERAIPHARAWPIEKRREMMRDVVRIIADKCALKLENAPAIARTYGPHITVAEVEAEMLKYQQEGEGK